MEEPKEKDVEIEEKSSTSEDVLADSSPADSEKAESLPAEEAPATEPVEGEGGEEEESLPFHKHPRWIERTEELKRLRPLAEKQKKLLERLAAANMDESDLETMVELGGLVVSNPKEAAKRLQSLADSLLVREGEKLPEDLRKKVEDGLVDEETARELARLRVSKGEAGKGTALAVQTAAQAWTEAKLRSDPGFRRRLELVRDRVHYLSQTNPGLLTPSGIVSLLEQADSEVQNYLRSIVPAAPAKKVLTGRGASDAPKPRSLAEAMELAGAKYRE